MSRVVSRTALRVFLLLKCDLTLFGSFSVSPNDLELLRWLIPPKSCVHFQDRILRVSGVLYHHTSVHDDTGISQFPTGTVGRETGFKGVPRRIHTLSTCSGVHGCRLSKRGPRDHVILRHISLRPPAQVGEQRYVTPPV